MPADLSGGNGHAEGADPRHIVAWDGERMSTGDDGVDRQHRDLIRMINELHVACADGRGKEQLKPMLGFLGQYVRDHFRYEEELMERTQCPVRAKNKVAHEHFLKRFSELAAKVESNGASLAVLLDIKTLLADWLVSHICSVDTSLRECDGAHGSAPSDDTEAVHVSR